ncbi:MAG: hypothetical protein PUP92_34860 [Rhizonema sp. PD38]|nr:hypothetical protein [Rhizonema sp. PD38]
MNRTMDFLFTDSFAFAINATLGTLLRTKICNYSWDEEDKKDKPTKETHDSHVN